MTFDAILFRVQSRQKLQNFMGKVKSLMPTNLRVMGVLRIVGVKRNRGLADRFFFINFQELSRKICYQARNSTIKF